MSLPTSTGPVFERLCFENEGEVSKCAEVKEDINKLLQVIAPQIPAKIKDAYNSMLTLLSELYSVLIVNSIAFLGRDVPCCLLDLSFPTRD